MFCGQCGTKNEDGAEFCTNCGAKLLTDIDIKDGNTVPTQDANALHRKIGIIAVAVVAVLVVILGCSLFGGRSDTATVKKYLTARYSGDAEAVFDLMPKKMVNYVLDQYDYERDEMIDEVAEDYAYDINSYTNKLGQGWKMTYTITNETETTTSSTLADYKEYMGIKVTALKYYDVEITLTGSAGTKTLTTRVYLAKVGKSWYLNGAYFGYIY
jgi:hypothetical protein